MGKIDEIVANGRTVRAVFFCIEYKIERFGFEDLSLEISCNAEATVFSGSFFCHVVSDGYVNMFQLILRILMIYR